ncbi:hypothetical protein OH76DRAFT_299113 [Lentinus brumalis]|uniref:Uncharacterized protein n=1 Tax=Lentinus brumalis TaxID=2498619 RepID=A0A371DG44_9APHY|nr:hypothetical protein OH76DRAFT_299113 [Polyporus brumalis]
MLLLRARVRATYFIFLAGLARPSLLDGECRDPGVLYLPLRAPPDQPWSTTSRRQPPECSKLRRALAARIALGNRYASRSPSQFNVQHTAPSPTRPIALRRLARADGVYARPAHLRMAASSGASDAAPRCQPQPKLRTRRRECDGVGCQDDPPPRVHDASPASTFTAPPLTSHDNERGRPSAAARALTRSGQPSDHRCQPRLRSAILSSSRAPGSPSVIWMPLPHGASIRGHSSSEYIAVGVPLERRDSSQLNGSTTDSVHTSDACPIDNFCGCAVRTTQLLDPDASFASST